MVQIYDFLPYTEEEHTDINIIFLTVGQPPIKPMFDKALWGYLHAKTYLCHIIGIGKYVRQHG